MQPKAHVLFRPVRRPDRRGLACSVCLSIGLAVLVNALIFGLGYGEQPADEGDSGPVNAVIEAIVPFVWIGLFGAMGAAFWILQRGQHAIPGAAWWVMLLLLNCASYPAYTLGFQSRDLGLAGNYLTALLAVVCVTASWHRSKVAALLVLPVVVWVTLASAGLYAIATGRQF